MITLVEVAKLIATSIQTVFERPARYNPSTPTENTLVMYFRFAAVVSGNESAFESELRKAPSRIGYAWGRFTEGYYRDHPDAKDAAVRKFVVTQFDDLASALQIRLPRPRGSSSRTLGPRSVHDGGAVSTAAEDVSIASAVLWARECIRQACDDPLSRRSAYDLEDELVALFWFWGILVVEADDVDDKVRPMMHAYGSNTTLTEQFFFERPWATREEAIAFIRRAYKPVWQAILEPDHGQTDGADT